LFWLIHQIPGFSAVRAVARVVLVMMLPLSALFGLMIDDLATAQAQYSSKKLFAVALSLFVVVECTWIEPYAAASSVWQMRMNALAARMPRTLPSDAILAVASEPGWPGLLLTQTDADLAAVNFGISTLNGYSGSNPPAWKPMATCADVKENLQAGRHFLMEHGFPAPNITRDRLVLIGLGPCDTDPLSGDPLLHLEHTYGFAARGDGSQFIAEGFSQPEDWGRWTNATDAFLFFSLAGAPSAPVSITIEGFGIPSSSNRPQTVDAAINGTQCGRLIITTSWTRATVTCPVVAFRPSDNMLRLRVAHLTRPIDIGLNSDRRHLGVGIRSLTFAVGE
jgi:hypothetical protein